MTSTYQMKLIITILILLTNKEGKMGEIMKWRDNSSENVSGPDKLSLWAGEKRLSSNTNSWLAKVLIKH